MTATLATPTTTSETARKKMLSSLADPLFLGDWAEPAFIHFEVDADQLQPHVPYPLDCRNGKAYLSLVAFRMRGLRFARGGEWTRWLTRPIANHAFLNLRTYVIKNGEPGIHFINEWLNSRLATLLGPITFALPYRFAKINYQFKRGGNAFCGKVEANGKAIQFRAKADPEKAWQPATERTLSEFLLERYTAFNAQGGWRAFFRVWHQPWAQKPMTSIEIEDLSLLEDATGAKDWLPTLKLVGGNISPGANDVWMGRPHPIF